MNAKQLTARHVINDDPNLGSIKAVRTVDIIADPCEMSNEVMAIGNFESRFTIFVMSVLLRNQSRRLI